MKLSKIAFAVASTLVIASGAAFAGQIGSSSVTVAEEVIVTDAQVVRAPSNNYLFAGNVDARTNQQLLQLQYKLDAGTWGTTVFPTANVLVPINVTFTAGQNGAAPTGAGVTAMLQVSYKDSAGTQQSTFPSNTTVNAFVDTARTTLTLNVSIPAGATNLLTTPSFTVNASPNAGANENAGIAGLFSVVGAIACPSPDKNININFKHFTTNNGTATLITAATPDSEHVRGGSTNDARLMSFVQNQIFTFVPAPQASRLDATFLNQRLLGQNFVAVTASATARGFANNLVAIAAPATRHYLGRLNLVQQKNGTDLNYANFYGAAAVATPLAAGDFSIAANATTSAGAIEAVNFGITITLPTAVPVGTTFRLTQGDGAVLGGSTVQTTVAGQTTVTFTDITPADFASLASRDQAVGNSAQVGGGHLFAEFPGNAVIPQLASVAVSAVLRKAPNTGLAANDVSEQSLTCLGTFAGIGGGIKIDVRNYASRAKFPTGNYASYVRLINNSEFNTADVFAQMIYADGTYGPYGQLPSLLPRAVANYSNAALEALMITTPAAVNPFGATTAYTQTAGTTTIGTGSGGSAAAIGDRVRFVSNTGTTLRVQSYILLPNGNLLDTTNAQGVDFETSTNNRVPSTAIDAQPVSQDAINGLAR